MLIVPALCARITQRTCQRAEELGRLPAESAGTSPKTPPPPGFQADRRRTNTGFEHPPGNYWPIIPQHEQCLGTWAGFRNPFPADYSDVSCPPFAECERSGIATRMFLASSGFTKSRASSAVTSRRMGVSTYEHFEYS
jgi:hypothetical protein